MDAAGISQEQGFSVKRGWTALSSRLRAVDHACFRWMAGLSFPKFISLPLILLVRVGDGWIWGALALYLFWAVPFSLLQTAFFHCLLAFAISLALYLPTKFLVKRPRPYDAGLDVTPMVPPLDKYSFPSGHTMNNLAVALTLSLYLPALRGPAIAVPLFVGLLRILFGVHYLTDIAGGALLGSASYFIAKAFFPVADL